MFKQISAAIILSFVMGGVAMAQTAPKTDQNSEKSKTKPKEKPAEKSKEKAKSNDLDAFFKKGVQQMEDGPSCQPAPEPIV